MGVNTPPQSPRKSSETRHLETAKESPNTSPRTHDPSSTSSKSKPLPPKKPLPSLPKELAQAIKTYKPTASKPPLPQKPPSDLASSSKSESSVAALAQKLSTMPVFPFRDTNSGKPASGSSPRPSPHSSPRPSPRNPPLDKSDSKPVSGLVKSSDVAKPKLLPKPGASLEKPYTGKYISTD